MKNAETRKVSREGREGDEEPKFLVFSFQIKKSATSGKAGGLR
jgi:hypothetical protein